MYNLNRTVLRYTVLVFVFIFALSCKSKKALVDGAAANTSSAKEIIKEHYQNQLDFKTLRGKLKIDYSDGDGSKGVSVSFRMEKDKAIWMSAPFGVVKAYITPDRVSFYNKLENEFFDGDFSYLSNILGTELDFNKVQNLLLGQALFDLRKEKYAMEVIGKNYQLTPKKSMALFQTVFQIKANNFKIANQKLSQPIKKRFLEIDYQEYQRINKWVVPNTILITAIEENTKNTIEIEYRNIEFDQELSFPYKVPKGYKEIVLKKDDI